MPFNGSGTHTPYTPGNPVVTGTTISSTAFNATQSDLSASLTNTITRDGQSPPTANLPMGARKLTGLAAGSSAGDSARWEQLFSHTLPATLASATTTDIGAQNTTAIEITGTTTITGFGTTYNGPRFLRFAGALILTHSAALNLTGAANITTAAGDTCIAIPNAASSGWNVFSYQRATLGPDAALLKSGVSSLASATTTNVGAGNSLLLEITGTTTITGFGTTYNNGPRFLRFAGVLVLTHSASLNLPGAANITTAAGDTCVAIQNAAASGWNVFAFQRAASISATEAFVNTLMSAPAVMAYQTVTGATLVNATATRVGFNTERYDTNNCFASPVFTPNVAGIYHISAAVKLPSQAPGFLSIYRNGSEYKRGAWTALASAALSFDISSLVECNGTTDFIEIFAYQSSGGSINVEGGEALTWFDATWQRRAV